MSVSVSGALSFTQTSVTYQLIDLTAAGLQAAGGTGAVTYSSSNTKIIQVDSSTGKLRFLNGGTASITATDAGGATATYSVTVQADPATYRINGGNTYELTGTGKLGDKHVTDIPGITAQFGTDGEVTVVRSVGGGIGATTIDTNGYSFVYKSGNYPTMGSFYKFTPETNGWLDVWGYFTDTTQPLVLTTENGTQVGTLAAATGSQQHGYWQLTAGTVYYLYTNPQNWFSLTSFKFAPSLSFANKSVRLKTGATAYTQTVREAVSGVTYSAKFMGGMSGSIVASTGAVTMSGTGGAVEVTAQSGSSTAYYVISVPYQSHTWVFNSTAMPVDELKAETDWTLAYKVVTRDASQNITRVNSPVLANGSAFDGVNAHFVSATAGLLINTPAKGFGATASLTDTTGLSPAQKYYLPYTKVSSVDKLTIKRGTVITIPDVKAGQYVKVRWQRYSPSVGNMVKVTNLTDLDGTDMTAGFEIGTPTAGNKYVGWMMFKVKADGDVTLQGDVDGWVNIDQIQLYAPGTVGVTDLLIKKSGNVAAPTFYNYMVKDGVAPETLATETYETGRGNINAVSGPLALEFSLKPQSEVTASITAAGALTVTSGYGTIIVVEKLKSTNGYVVDMKEMPVAINKGMQTTVSYPYTWDFVGRSEEGRKIPSEETLTAFTQSNASYWKNNNSGILGLMAVDETYGLQRQVEGSEMWIGNAVIREAKGLRVKLNAMTADNNNKVTLGSNGALSVAAGAVQQITMAGVPANAKIYVHGKKQSGATLTLGGTDLAAVDGATDVYMSQVSAAGDATLNVAGVDIYRIGVSVDEKPISAVGAATEARSYAVNYDYAQTFLGKELKAYAVTGVNADNSQLTTAPVPRVAAGTGVMLRPSVVESAATTWPLFTTDINDNTVTADNRLVGVVTPPAANVDQTTNIDGTDFYNYMLSTKGYSVSYPEGSTTGAVKENVNGLGFYLVLKQGTKMADGSAYAGGKPKANSAYLQLDSKIATHTGTDADPGTGAAAKTFYMIGFLTDDLPETTAIDDVRTEDEAASAASSRSQDDSYYTLQGVRVDRPGKGIYIHRGKKVVFR
ncbi:MAG: hypothetical protein MSD82_03525 [Prevotella sp.]|nr:hypothetical protein [Prevotella sp.]